ncbi:phosphatases II, partial [Ascodesmis nigricans]
DWKYEQRREAQQLLPHLWLGPLSSLRQSDFLLTHNITQVINVRSHMSRGVGIIPKLPPGVTYNSVDSTSPHDLASKFPLAADIIDSHLLGALPPHLQLSGGITLLYCESGNDRSAAVATAYIMQHLDITAIQAIQYIQAKRFCVSLDEWAKWTL